MSTTFAEALAPIARNLLRGRRDHEILRVTGGLAAPTVSAVLNRAALGSAADIREALLRITGN